jgi:dTDP-4-amino-4,6-dideoxygalactose transaminase
MADRDGLIRHLNAAKIGTGIHYPIPLHMQHAYAWMGYRPGEFPVTKGVAAEIVSLPMFPNLTKPQQTRVCEAIRTFTSQSARSHEDMTEGKLVSAD